MSAVRCSTIERLSRVRVFVADDHPVFREGLVRAVSGRAEMVLAGEAIDGRAALDAIQAEPPDVALVDLRLPVLDGIAIARAVVREGLATRVVILSAYDDAELVWAALEAGAVGYLTKDARREEITDGVLAAARGETVLAPSLAGALAGEVRRRAGTPVLTSREREALAGLARGLSAPAIARELVLSTATVKTHLQHLYEKLGVSDRAAAVAEAMRRGLIE
jgi:two-component system nitrate/nitrite response regulator NarL